MVAPGAQPSAEALEEALGAGEKGGGELAARALNGATGAQGGGGGDGEIGGLECGGEIAAQREEVAGAKELAPAAEDGGYLEGVQLGDVAVGAGGDQAEDVFKRGADGVVRMKPRVGEGEGFGPGGLRRRQKGEAGEWRRAKTAEERKRDFLRMDRRVKRADVGRCGGIEAVVCGETWAC